MTFSKFSKHKTISTILLTAMISPASTLAAQNEPFKVNLVTREQVRFKPDCPSQFGGSTTGTGESTHLGKVSFTDTNCITPMDDHFTFEGEFTLIAGGGSTLTGNYGGSFVPIDTGLRIASRMQRSRLQEEQDASHRRRGAERYRERKIRRQVKEPLKRKGQFPIDAFAQSVRVGATIPRRPTRAWSR